MATLGKDGYFVGGGFNGCWGFSKASNILLGETMCSSFR
jgi:hypothetical protein